MSRRTLPRSVVWVVRSVVPRHRAGEVLADLEDDYGAVQRRGRLARWLWLTRESTSILLAYVTARATVIGRIGPMCARDARLVARGFRKGPLAAVGAAAMLSTGLAAVLLTAGLSQALLFRQVSSVHGSALHRVGTIDRQGRESLRLSYPELDVIRAQMGDAARVSAVNMQPVVIRRGTTSVQTMVEAIDGRYLDLVGATAVQGRGLFSTDDLPSAPPAAVISQVFWRRHFASDPSVAGRTIALNGASFTIVGVLRESGSASFLGASVDVWVPIAHADPLLNPGWRTNVTDRWFTIFALASDGQPALEAHLAAASTALAARFPEDWRERRLMASAATVVSGSQRTAAASLAAILAGLALLILVTAAANLSGVFLARAAAGRRQAAIHLAIGSGRAAVVRRHMIEGAAIGLAAAALALALYAWVRVQLVEIALLPTLSLRLELPFTPALVAAVAAAGALAGIAFAAMPALWAARVELSTAMRDADTRVSSGSGVARMRQLLVSAQVGLALALMTGALKFTESLDALRRAEIGFNRDRLVAMDFDVEPAATSAEALATHAREAIARVAAMPGVTGAAMASRAPVDQSTPSIDVRADQSNGRAIGDSTFYLVTPGYFGAVGIRIVSGRGFSEDEGRDAAEVVVVNQTLAHRAWPQSDPIGRGLYLEREGKRLRVVGVAQDSKYRSIAEAPAPHFYRPTPPRLGLTLLVRTSADPRETLGAVQQLLNTVGPGLVGFFPRTLDDHLAIDLLPTRAAVSAASALGALALVFCGVGLYGLVSWFVALRHREIGIRMALGASAADVRRLVIGQAATTALPGLVLGTILTIGLSVLARSALFGVGPFDLRALAISLVVLSVLVTLASYFPARRATRVDPSTSLRAN